MLERPVGNAINAKSFAFHYALFVHNQSGSGNTASGCSEVGGNDFMVSLGSWALAQVDGTSHNVGSIDQQAGTFMHELGHNLGLRHGGGDNINCKPNYQSVMNYALQTSNVLTGRPLDYSRQLLAPLNEASLAEATGVGALPGTGKLFLGKVVFGPQSGVPSKAQVVTVSASGSIDWSRSSATVPLTRDLNNLNIVGCPGTAPATLEGLVGFDDWANIDLNFRASVDFAGGATSTIEDIDPKNVELTLEDALSLSRDVIDYKPGGDPNNTTIRSITTIVNVAMFSRRDDQNILEFDARNLDPATMFLRGTSPFSWAVPVKQSGSGFQCKTQDVNKDGVQDVVCQFQIPANTLTVGETKVILEATTFDGD